MKIKIVAPIFGFENIGEVNFEQIDDFFVRIWSDDISLTLIDPSKIREYSFDIPLHYKELLNIDDTISVSVYNTVIINSDIEKSTINFLAPILINTKENILVQVALDESKYSEYGLSEFIGKYI
jgi:flagellar assembly factor FliW